MLKIVKSEIEFDRLCNLWENEYMFTQTSLKTQIAKAMQMEELLKPKAGQP